MMLRHFRFAVMVCAFLVVEGVSSQSFDYDRGVRNYKAVIEGTKKLEELSEVEKQEVVAIARAMGSRGSENESGDCVEARERAEASAAELANYARRLRNCAESSDFTDDCSTEFRRVRNAHSDYES